MTDLPIAGPLATALAAKGYETLTPVQNAMLGEGVAGRDLLVSAQTGSGKTVAFGIAIADELLRGADQLLYADTPMALVIAPTRELALQVARELEWLYSGASARIATCVGGMDYRTEKRTLDRGAHIVVGTPGRLRDHIERKSLDLSGLRAAVLDEADEMLDLGFREDLEFILGMAPAERRTLMFSATVPKEIAKLAQDFQRDALRIQTQGEARQHVDIEYRAISVAVRDREHAIFNLLRFYDSKASLVFCKTRANVNHLFARMSNRGFRVVALSGELSQSERTHALQALRDGRADVCIATDVAARGIDLPGLDLVVHADLPSNSETLLHRSGRTGRAGNKGVSALIVAPSEFKKAQRLLQGAKVVAEWVKPPSADDVQGRDDLRLIEHPALALDVGDEADLAATLVAQYGAEQVAAAFIRLWREGRSAPEVLSDNLAVPDNAPPRERGEFGASVWFQLSVGRSGRAEARWLLPKICEAGGITKDGIGAIRVQDDRTFVQIAQALAGKFGQGLELESGVTMTRIEGEPDLDRPERKPAGKPERKAPMTRVMRDEPARDKPAYVPKPSREVEDDAGVVAEVVERKPYVKRDEPKPYAVKAEAERKPYVKSAPRGAGEAGPYPVAEKKPYVKRDDAKPYAPKVAGERAPYAKREDSKPYAAREGAAKKPYAPRGDAKPYAGKPDGERKTYAPRGDAKPYAPRAAAADGERKPYVKRDAPAGDKPRFGAKPEGFKPRSAGFKSHGAADGKPARAAGFKSHGAEGGKTFARPKPAAPRADAGDTSKRFVPPRKPKA
ncbi:MAG: DEAD/DEAH box helicase [Paracoccaceae bacterium]